MTMTLDGSGANTIGVPNAKTAKSATGTSVDFTGIPAGTKRITVMFSGVSTNGTSPVQLQIGAGSVTTTGYVSTAAWTNNPGGTNVASVTSGFTTGITYAASDVRSGQVVITNVSGNIWVSSTMLKLSTTTVVYGGGDVTLSGTLDRVRITTVNGTDTFDAGSINILYE